MIIKHCAKLRKLTSQRNETLKKWKMRNLSCWGRKCNKWGKWAYENNKKKQWQY